MSGIEVATWVLLGVFAHNRPLLFALVGGAHCHLARLREPASVGREAQSDVTAVLQRGRHQSDQRSGMREGGGELSLSAPLALRRWCRQVYLNASGILTTLMREPSFIETS
jgi:hypothetical protein